MFKVILVTTAEHAIKACESSAMDLAFLNAKIATIFGRACRSNSISACGGAKVPFIVLTASEEEQDTVSGAMSGAALSALPKSVVEALACTECLGSVVNTVITQCVELRALRVKLARNSSSGQSIDLATGIIMERNHLNARDAYAVLRDVSRRNRRKIADVSTEILNSQELSAELRQEQKMLVKSNG